MPVGHYPHAPSTHKCCKLCGQWFIGYASTKYCPSPSCQEYKRSNVHGNANRRARTKAAAKKSKASRKKPPSPIAPRPHIPVGKYGLAVMTLDEIGLELGITGERVRQIERIALEKFREAWSRMEREID
uniref:Putative sigma-70 region domain containing protein n=1 Tax=viral metagenome TaxID=1070528 RepID=A0A6M3IKM3_9ZZZZ